MSSQDDERTERGRGVPKTFWVASALWALFGAMHAVGLRDWVSVLSGTPVEGASWALAAAGGALYVLAWFGAVLVAPVFAIAAALITALEGPCRSRAPLTAAGARRHRSP